MRRREAPVGAVCLILLVAAESFAQVAILTDFEQHGRFIERSDILEFDDALFFGVGVRGSDQRELWKFDGNKAQLVSDRFIGARDSSIDEFVSFRGELYFTADDGDTGTELWRYDGTRVSLAADVEPGANGSRPTGLVVHNDHLMFSAQNGNSYSNLWSFDGTQANLIARFGNPSSSISTGATIGSDFYFGADDGVHGSELWRYDGRDIHHVADIEPGNVGSFPRNLVAIDETLYFAAQTTDAGREVWKYDGQSVQMIDDIDALDSWSNPLHLTERGGQLYFSAASSRERFMWEYDGAVLTQMGQGGGPIFDANRPLLLRGHREGEVEVQELWEMTARVPDCFGGLLRQLVRLPCCRTSSISPVPATLSN